MHDPNRRRIFHERIKSIGSKKECAERCWLKPGDILQAVLAEVVLPDVYRFRPAPDERGEVVARRLVDREIAVVDVEVRVEAGADPGGSEANCTPGTRHFGDLGRNSLVGPSFKEFNFSIFKNTAISERVVLQLRAEFFNLFNHPNFSNPSMPNFIADIGTPDAATGRQTGFYQITATGDVGIGNPFLGGGGPRGIQFAAKVTF